MSGFSIKDRQVGSEAPVYFIADISANHDGSLHRAIDLIHLAAGAGASAAKFQNFRAAHIVSARGFEQLGGQQSHQSTWKKSVFEVYKDASVPWDWTPILQAECEKAGIHYFSTPYDIEAIDMLDPYVPAYKVGSGDITWHEICVSMAKRGKPILIAAGASKMDDVERAVDAIWAVNKNVCLMQCNTNYTGSKDNFNYVNLNVLKTFSLLFPELVLGLSDHTPGHSTVLGAVALGARVIEKHFTDDQKRIGPDHPFSMTPTEWREMVDRTSELDAALGSPRKDVAANERQTVVIQRRCVRLKRAAPAGTRIDQDMLEVLRPAPADGIPPYRISEVVGRTLAVGLSAGDYLKLQHLQ